MAAPRPTLLLPLAATLFLSTASCFQLPNLPASPPSLALRHRLQPLSLPSLAPRARNRLHPLSMVLDATKLNKQDVSELGLTEWPSIARKGKFEETLKEGAVWYILEGSATVKCSGRDRPVVAEPGTLIEAIDCDEHMQVEVSEGEDLVILTPSYQEGGIFLGAVAFLVLGSAALFAVSSNMK